MASEKISGDQKFKFKKRKRDNKKESCGLECIKHF